MNARKDVMFLVGSQSREAILRALAAESRRPTALAEHCDCTRETTQRILTGFCDRGWVKRRSDRLHHPTPGGTTVHERYEQFIGTVECADQMSEFLTNAVDVCENAPPGVLGQTNITTATDNDPHAPLSRYLTIVGNEPVDRLRGVTPIVSHMFSEPTEAVLGEDTRMGLIIDHGILERSMDAYPDSFERARDLDRFELRVVEENLDLGLLVVDGHGLVSTYDEHNNLTALADSDASEVISWVEILYESVRSTSVLVGRLEPWVDADSGRDRVGHA